MDEIVGILRTAMSDIIVGIGSLIGGYVLGVRAANKANEQQAVKDQHRRVYEELIPALRDTIDTVNPTAGASSLVRASLMTSWIVR